MLAAVVPERKAGTFSGWWHRGQLESTTSLPSTLITLGTATSEIITPIIINPTLRIRIYRRADRGQKYINLEFKSCVFTCNVVIITVNETSSRLLFIPSRVFDRVLLQPAHSKLSSQVKRRREYKQITTFPCFPLFQHELIIVLVKMWALSTET